MKHEPIQPQVPLIDNMFAPDLFVSGVSGVGAVDGVILLTLEGARYDHSRAVPAAERVVVGRLAMTVPAAQMLVAGLNNFLSQQGLSPAEAFGRGATRQ